jgi:hypothetical protein
MDYPGYPHEPGRPLTDAEWNSLTRDFPYMNRSFVQYWGPATPIYNCLAWSLDIQTSWMWPWVGPDTKVTIDEFYTLYKSWGVFERATDPSLATPITFSGILDNDMKHGAIFIPEKYKNNQRTWSSKMGSNILISHPYADLWNGLYGVPQGSAGPARPEALREAALKAARKGANTPQDSGSAEEIIYSISEAETHALRQQVNKLTQEVKDLFERQYAAWKQTWTQPAIQASSNPYDYARSKEFNDLVAMGPDILPLLVEKMSNGREFLALQAVERLLPPSLIFRPALDNPLIFGGEQLRAHMTAKRWLASL